VTVTLLDKNDNQPQFVLSFYNASIRDTFLVNDPVLTVAADDADIGNNSLISFNITSATHPGMPLLSGLQLGLC